MTNALLVGEQAKSQGGIQWNDEEVKTEFVDPINPGKRIYRKAVDFGALPNTTTKTVAHGITGLNLATGAWIRFGGTAVNGTAAEDVASIVDAGTFFIDATNISMAAAGDQSAYSAIVWIEYTKT